MYLYQIIIKIFPKIPENAILGTSSLRRQSQVKALHPKVTTKDLRGNVGTRLRKLDEGDI